MAFAQLTARESLRDIEACLKAMEPKLYHAGLRGNVSKSTLGDANKNRDCRIYGDFARALISRAKENINYTRRASRCIGMKTGLLSDLTIVLKG